MASDERITMKNPNTGRDDRTISRAMYEPVRDAILATISDAGELPWTELTDQVHARTPAEMWADASVGWYTVTVKLHLEATGLLQRKGSPQILSLTETGHEAASTAS